MRTTVWLIGLLMAFSLRANAQGDHRLVVCQGLVAFQNAHALVRSPHDRLAPPIVHRDVIDNTSFNCPLPNHTVTAIIWQSAQGELSSERLNLVWKPVVEQFGGSVTHLFESQPFQGGLFVPTLKFTSTHAGFATMHELWLMWVGEGYAGLILSCETAQPEIMAEMRTALATSLRVQPVRYHQPPPPPMAERRVAGGAVRLQMPERFDKRSNAELDTRFGSGPNPARPAELWSGDPSDIITLSVYQPDARVSGSLTAAQMLEAHALRKLQMGAGSERIGSLDAQTPQPGGIPVVKLAVQTGGRKTFLVVTAVETRNGTVLLEYQCDYGQRDRWEPIFENSLRSLESR